MLNVFLFFILNILHDVLFYHSSYIGMLYDIL